MNDGMYHLIRLFACFLKVTLLEFTFANEVLSM